MKRPDNAPEPAAPPSSARADASGGGWRRLPKWLGGAHFSVVEPGVLSRSAMPTPKMIDWLKEAMGVRTLVTFREDAEGDWEEAYVEGLGLRFYTFDMGSKRPPRDWQVERWRKILADRENWPIHCHCGGGADRTGVMVALYRIEHQGWGIERALRELTLKGGVRERSKVQRDWLAGSYAEARAVRRGVRAGGGTDSDKDQGEELLTTGG